MAVRNGRIVTCSGKVPEERVTRHAFIRPASAGSRTTGVVVSGETDRKV